MYRKPKFWIIFAVVVIAAGYFCLTNFGRIMSFINLDITMDRQEALAAARADSGKWSVGPDSSRQAVLFNENSYLQFYIELEAGGKEAYNAFLAEGKYQPYNWVVRHFVPGKEHRAYFFYTPSGEFYGFSEVIPESEPGNNLSVEAAQTLGEKAACDMGVPLAEFELIETQKNETISERMDYTFVYERPEKLGEARYRFQIGVSGDEVSELSYNMKIPQAFRRRFSEMRSANNTIASTSQYAMLFLYGLLGIGLGAFYLLRVRYLLYKKALLAAFIVAFLGFLASLNRLPISWVWYDTAVSTQSHVMQQISMSFLQFLQDFFILALSFIVAESLTRLALPSQVRFWKTLSPAVAPSKRILGNTLGAYGLVAINLAYVLGFYLFTEHNFGWWNPAGLQVNPNFIAMPLPWLSVLSMALHAGFWEEALFRAIPLAGMILIGRRLNKEKLFLVLGLILQALIFSAGHANYAAQPAYARVVELIVPSLIFAFLYLRFGLYAAILLHFTFDAVLMAMYIWIMQAPGIWLNRVLVIIGILLPLLLIVYWRIRRGKWIKVAEPFLNEHWQPAPPKPPKAPEFIESSRTFNPKTIAWLIIFAVLGAVLWFDFTKFKPDQSQMRLSREQAIKIAEAELEKQNIELEGKWRTDARLINRLSDADKLVWQSGGKEIYQAALGKYIAEPVWEVSFRTFSGDVAERAEAYSYRIDTKGEVKGFDHELPEDLAGAELSEEEAGLLAQKSLEKFFELADFGLDEVQAVPNQKPERLDWQFVWRDTLHYPLETGEYRYKLGIMGDKVMSARRYTYVPEEWSRQERSKTRPIGIFSSFASVIHILFYVLIGILAIVSWSNHRFNLKAFFFVLITVFAANLLLRLNGWQQAPAGFSTSEPWSNQVLQYLLGSVTNIIMMSFTLGLLAGFLGSWQNKVINRLGLLNAPAAAISFAGFAALVTIIKPDHLPWRPEMNYLADYSPFLHVLAKNISQWITSALLFSFLIQWLRRITQNGQNRKFLTWLIFFLYIIILKQAELVYATFGDFAYLAVLAAVLAFVLYFLFRQLLVFDITILPVFVSKLISLALLQKCLANPWQGARISYFITIVVINLLAVYWMNILRKTQLKA